MAVAANGGLFLSNRRDALQICLDRPERHNALDLETLGSLRRVLAANRLHPRTLVLRGEQDTFSIGGDVQQLADFDFRQAAHYSGLAQQACREIERWPGVTIAYVEGCAFGLGLELALACDVIVARTDARFGLPGLPWLLMPCTAVAQRLQARCDRGVMRSLLLGGSLMDAGRARATHLADRVITHAGDLTPLIERLGEFQLSAIEAIRQVRLARCGPINDADVRANFARPFADGSCPERLQALLTPA